MTQEGGLRDEFLSPQIANKTKAFATTATSTKMKMITEVQIQTT